MIAAVLLAAASAAVPTPPGVAPTPGATPTPPKGPTFCAEWIRQSNEGYDRLTLFRKLEFLAPHKAIEVFLDRSASYFARGEPTTLTAAISWRTSAGVRRRATIVHDLEIYRDLGYIEREVPQRGRPA